jgi:ABC-type branched-subunit amino acid transport system substrate-binding protein
LHTALCYRQHVKRCLLALLIVAACHHGTRHTLVPDVPTTGNATARSRFQDAKAKFLRDGTEGSEFAQIVEDFPQDPIVPWAELYAGMASLKDHKYGDADAHFTKAAEANADAGLSTRARMFLGITKNYEGDAATARKLLAGTDQAIENDDERTEWLAAAAYATAAGDKPLAALPIFDQLYARVTPTERAVIVARVEDVVAGADPNLLARVYDELADRKGPSIAVVGSRLVLIAEQTGDAQRAAKLRTDLAPVRAAVGLPATITATQAGGAAATGGNPGLIGAVIPIGSKTQSRVAEAAIAGLGLAAGAPSGTGVAAIETRKAVDQTEAAAAVDDLASKNVVAIIGPIDGASVDAAAARAGDHQVPLISLATAPEQRTSGAYVFHVRHAAEARARTLAQRALAKGVKTFAVLAPENGYGKAVGAAFVAAVAKGGGTVVKTVTYPRGTKSFAEQAAQLGTGWTAVFVPDQADTLGLIAPALAATGNLPRPMPFPKKVIGGRPVLLLSTAEDLNDQYLVNAGRHSEGALLAPGFYPDDDDPKQKPFIDAFKAAYGHPPTATDAYAYDAAELVAAGAAGGRAGLAQTLSAGQLAGVTGTIQFDKDHRRADPGVLYTVVQETGGVYAIRVANP